MICFNPGLKSTADMHQIKQNIQQEKNIGWGLTSGCFKKLRKDILTNVHEVRPHVDFNLACFLSSHKGTLCMFMHPEESLLMFISLLNHQVTFFCTSLLGKVMLFCPHALRTNDSVLVYVNGLI